MKFSLLINMKMPTIVGIFISISREKFMLSWVKHEKIFITSGPESLLDACHKVHFLTFCLILFVDGISGGFCSGTVQCKDVNAACINNICQCNAGYTDTNGNCNKGVLFYSHIQNWWSVLLFFCKYIHVFCTGPSFYHKKSQIQAADRLEEVSIET